MTIASYPALRMRRTRATAWSRAMHAENRLSPSDFIWPLFVTEGDGVEEPIAALPGVSRWSVDLMVARAKEARDAGIPCLALFPNTQADRRSEDGAEALNPDNLMCRAIRAIKQACGGDIGLCMHDGGQRMQRGRGVHVDPLVHQPQRKITKLGAVHMAAEIAVIGHRIQIGEKDLKHRIHALHDDPVPVGRAGNPRYFGGHLLAQVLDLVKASLIVGQHRLKHRFGDVQCQPPGVVGAKVQDLAPFQPGHHIVPPPDQRHRHAAPHRFAIGDQIRRQPVQFGAAARRRRG